MSLNLFKFGCNALRLSAQAFYTHREWIYGPITKVRHGFSHIDTTRNLSDEFFLQHWAMRLCRIMVHIEGLIVGRGVGPRNKTRLDLKRRDIMRNIGFRALVQQAANLGGASFEKLGTNTDTMETLMQAQPSDHTNTMPCSRSFKLCAGVYVLTS